MACGPVSGCRVLGWKARVAPKDGAWVASDMGPWGWVYSRHSKHVTPLLSSSSALTLGQAWAGVSEPIKIPTPHCQGLEICEGGARKVGVRPKACGQCWSAGGAGQQKSFRKLLDHMTS